jgi:DNA-directed RNA polymerase subunit RPC12/RpoP
MTNYQCKKCGILLQSDKQPSGGNCPSGGPHSWTNLGKTGQTNYQCKKCGILLQSDKQPSGGYCRSGGPHSWTKL